MKVLSTTKCCSEERRGERRGERREERRVERIEEIMRDALSISK